MSDEIAYEGIVKEFDYDPFTMAEEIVRLRSSLSASEDNYQRRTSEFIQTMITIDDLRSRLATAERQLEVERMRLAACGVAALGYFEGCADECRSASLDDVLRLHARLAAAERVVEAAIAECEQPDVVKSHALWQEILAYRAALATPTAEEVTHDP